MSTPLNYDPTDADKQRLPVGTSCGGCKHIKRCASKFEQYAEDIYCAWSPSQFRPATKPGK